MTNEELEQLMKELQEKILGGIENETQTATQTTQEAQQGNQTVETYEETQEPSRDDVDEQQLQCG